MDVLVQYLDWKESRVAGIAKGQLPEHSEQDQLTCPTRLPCSREGTPQDQLVQPPPEVHRQLEEMTICPPSFRMGSSQHCLARAANRAEWSPQPAKDHLLDDVDVVVVVVLER
jgi:hypothetical protein